MLLRVEAKIFTEVRSDLAHVSNISASLLVSSPHTNVSSNHWPRMTQMCFRPGPLLLLSRPVITSLGNAGPAPSALTSCRSVLRSRPGSESSPDHSVNQAAPSQSHYSPLPPALVTSPDGPFISLFVFFLLFISHGEGSSMKEGLCFYSALSPHHSIRANRRCSTNIS